MYLMHPVMCCHLPAQAERSVKTIEVQNLDTSVNADRTIVRRTVGNDVFEVRLICNLCSIDFLRSQVDASDKLIDLDVNVRKDGSVNIVISETILVDTFDVRIAAVVSRSAIRRSAGVWATNSIPVIVVSIARSH